LNTKLITIQAKVVDIDGSLYCENSTTVEIGGIVPEITIEYPVDVNADRIALRKRVTNLQNEVDILEEDVTTLENDLAPLQKIVASGTLSSPNAGDGIVDPYSYGAGEYRLVIDGFTTSNALKLRIGSSFTTVTFGAFRSIAQDTITNIDVDSTLETSAFFSTLPIVKCNSQYTVMSVESISPTSDSDVSLRKTQMINQIAGETVILVDVNYTGDFNWQLIRI